MPTQSTTTVSKPNLAHCSFNARLHDLALVLVGASLLVGCVPYEPFEKVTAEQFRTNFPAYAGKTVGFEAYYTKEPLGTKTNERTSEQTKVFRYDFFSDAERSLKVASFTSTQDTVRDKVFVKVPVDTNEGNSVTVEWHKLKFSGVDDISKPVNPGAVDRHLDSIRVKDPSPELHTSGPIR